MERNTERNFGKELNSMKAELNEIKSILKQISPALSSPIEDNDNNEETFVHKSKNMHPNPSIMTILDQLENKCNEDGDTNRGRLTYLGLFVSGNRQSTWVRNEVSANDLLALIEDKLAEKVLACIGSGDRLNILLSILKKPMTVAQLVDECGYNSTGQVYHHLKPLLTADLVTEDAQNEGKGCYVIQPHRVQGIIMLLAGISDMIDPHYTVGKWEENF